MSTFISLAFQSFAYGCTLYLIAVGLSLTLGLMRFANLAHGVFAMGGGYVASLLIRSAGVPWIVIVIVVPVATGLVAIVSERLLFRRMYSRNDLDQILLSIGLIYMATAAARYFYGSYVMPVTIPPVLFTNISFLGFDFQIYKVLLSVIGCAVATITRWSVENTDIGAMLRASVENRGMAESVGVRTKFLFAVTFALGGMLAAAGGILGSELFSINPSYALDVLVLITIVVAIAGLGTAKGVFLASILVGLVQTAGLYLLPAAGNALLFLLVFTFLIWRPRGLFGVAP